MSLDQIANILKESPLDTETKLFVIDLIAMSQDEKLVQDVMDLVLEWKKADAEMVQTLQDGLFALVEEHQQRVAAMNSKQALTGLEIADEIKREEKIETIRQQLKKTV